MLYNILDMKLTYRCNNNCKYCCQDRKLRDENCDLELSRIIKILDNEPNVDKVVLTGGEPTLSKDLFKIIELIRAKNIKNIQLQSNGRNLKDENFLKQLLKRGINSFGISLHGCSPQMHESFTGTKGSFADVINALENLKKYNVPVALNCVITKHNINQLEEIVNFVETRKYASSLQFAFIHITGKAADMKQDFVSISDSARKVRNVLEKTKGIELKIYTEAIPFCLMYGFEKNVSELRQPSRVITYDYEERHDFSDDIVHKLKVKSNKCTSCLFDSVCEGTWIEYPGLYGFGEFIPVTTFRSEY